MEFGNPRMLWLLPVALPLMAVFLGWALRKKQDLIRQFVQSRLLDQLMAGVSVSRQWIRAALLLIAVAAALLALARPQWGVEWETATQRGLDIVVAIDTSRSMLAEDIRPNRLARAKFAAMDLMKRARNDRLALVPFAGEAFLQCPLTLDEEAFRQSVEGLDVGIISKGGTALTGAIETALTAYKQDGENFKTLVLITDGEDHDSGALQAAERAAKAGMRIFTIGVGTPSGELLRMTDEHGQSSYVKDPQGNAILSRLNESLLRQIATDTGGFYLPLQAAGTIDTLYEKGLAPLPKSEATTRLIRRLQERYYWPLAIAVAVLLVEFLIPENRASSRSPVAAPPLRPAQAATRALLVAGGFFAAASAAASPSGALKDYEAGDYAGARAGFESLVKKRPDDARLKYNAGAAAYRSGAYEDAARWFEEALTAEDLQLQQMAYYNLGDSLYRLGERAENPKEKIEQWEKSLKQFEGATQLDATDVDARHNLEFVRRKLEELKQEQSGSGQDQKQNEDQQDKSDDQQEQSRSQDSAESQDPQDGQQSPREGGEKEESGQPREQENPGKEEQSGEQEPDASQDPGSPQQQNQNPADTGEPGDSKSPASGTPGEGETGGGSEARAANQMTVEQAEQLLDAQKGEERGLIFGPVRQGNPQERVFKDW